MTELPGTGEWTADDETSAATGSPWLTILFAALGLASGLLIGWLQGSFA